MRGIVEFKDEAAKEDALYTSRKEDEINFSLVELLKKTKLVRTDTQAMSVLIGLSGVLFFIAFVVMLLYVFDINRPRSRYYVPERYRTSFPIDIQQKMNTL